MDMRGPTAPELLSPLQSRPPPFNDSANPLNAAPAPPHSQNSDHTYRTQTRADAQAHLSNAAPAPLHSQTRDRKAYTAVEHAPERRGRVGLALPRSGNCARIADNRTR